MNPTPALLANRKEGRGSLLLPGGREGKDMGEEGGWLGVGGGMTLTPARRTLTQL